MRSAVSALTIVLILLSIIAVGPHVEARLFPCARGLEIEWSVADRIHIERALIRKSSGCEYIGMSARAGLQDLSIEFTKEFGSRPGGEFELRDVYIERPIVPAPIDIILTVDHRRFPFWVSRSLLFRLEGPL